MKKRFKLKRVFLAMLISYVSMLMIPAALAVGLTRTTNKMTVQRCINETMNDIKQGQQLLEMAEQWLSNVSTYNSTLQWVLKLDGFGQGDKNVFAISDFQEMLKQKFFDSLNYRYYNVVLKNDFVFTDSTVAWGRAFFYNNYRNYENMDYDTYILNSFLSEGRCLFPLQEITVNKNIVNAMTYNYPVMSSIKESGEADAVVQILIPVEELMSYFQQLLYQEQSQVHILDGQGNQLAFLSKQEGNTVSIDIKRMKEETGNFSIHKGKKNYIVIYNKSQVNNLIIAALFPESIVLKEASDLKRIVFIMMTFSILFELILGIFFARKYSTPIHNLMKNVQMMIHPEQDSTKDDNQNEYECLAFNINKIIQKNQSMESTIKEKQKKEYSNFLNYLFAGEFRENADIIREGEFIGLDFGGKTYCVVSLQMENTKKVLKWFSNTRIPHVIAGHEREKGYLSILFGFHDGGNPIYKERIGKTIDLFYKIGAEIEKVGIGKLYENEKDICFSYTQSLYCISLQKPLNETKMKFYDEVSQEFDAFYYPTELEERLMNCVKHGEIMQIKEIFKQMKIENIDKRYLTRSMGRILASNIAATLMKIYSDIIPDEQVNHFAEIVTNQGDLPQALDIIEEQFIKSCKSLEKSKDRRKEDYQQRLVTYIEENFSNPQLGVSMAAEEFTLSENYFSQFFKEVMNDSFSNYLEVIRLNKAKQYIEENKYDMEKISILVGYNNSGTFRRAFKRVTGITPSMWKRK
ncbi:MAG: helix-turn-helix domain-containing protein [Lachnospiraceae bacterium]